MTNEKMTETKLSEEDYKLAKEYAKLNARQYKRNDNTGFCTSEEEVEQAFLAGLKAGRPKWHKVADGDLPKGNEYGKNSIHRDIYLKDRYGNLYTGNYFPKDKNHKEDCFAVEFLEWEFQGSQFCKKSQIAEWCEKPKYMEE